MEENDVDIPQGWSETLSRQFMDYGRYFVPQREHQMEIIAAMRPQLDDVHSTTWTLTISISRPPYSTNLSGWRLPAFLRSVFTGCWQGMLSSAEGRCKVS